MPAMRQGNPVIAALSEMKHGIFDAVQELSDIMQVDGHIYPAANEPLELNAEFSGWFHIDWRIRNHGSYKLIKHVWVTSSAHKDVAPKAVDEVIDAIMDADQIVLTGSLFTSILPNLMIGNVGDALRKTQAEVVIFAIS